MPVSARDPAPPPRLSAIVPLYNGLAHTQAMLASWRRTVPSDLPHELIFVDDGSTDGTRAWLATLTAPIRVVLHDRNRGYAAANNRGAAVARGTGLLLLNNDLVLLPGWLQPMLEAQRTLGGRAGLIGNVQRRLVDHAVDHSGIIIDPKGKPAHDRSLPLRRWLPPRWSLRPVPAVTGACVLVDRELFRSAGGFCEDYVNGGEDVDLAFRLAAQGRIHAVALRSVVGHHVSASPGRKRRDEANTYLLVQRWRDQLVRHGARAWSRHHLENAWTSPRDPAAWPAAARLLAYALHLRQRPPTEALAGITAAIDLELARWRRLLGGDAAS